MLMYGSEEILNDFVMLFREFYRCGEGITLNP